MTTQSQQDSLFVAGGDGYHTFRIPALAVTAAGTVLAFCEGRRHGRGDAGEIDLVMKRSRDGGLTWSDLQVVVQVEGMTCGNPCPVVDRESDTIWLPFSQNPADGDEAAITAGRATRTVWLTRSRDDGRTWARPREISPQVKRPTWTWYATGPGHGIQLESGRLLVPCDHMEGIHFDRRLDPYRSHVIYSDDRGASWKIGGVVGDGTNECAVAETVDGRVYINCRNHVGSHSRAVAWSRDGGEHFEGPGFDQVLIEPVCQASLVRLSGGADHDRSRILFANPASTVRERLTVRLSYDEGESWPVARQLYGGPSAYSDLAVTSDMTILCLYERGLAHPYETLTLARFGLDWLEGSA